MTYVLAEDWWHYLVAVIDVCARRVVPWPLSCKPDADLVIKAWNIADSSVASREAYCFMVNNTASRQPRFPAKTMKMLLHTEHGGGAVTAMTMRQETDISQPKLNGHRRLVT